MVYSKGMSSPTFLPVGPVGSRYLRFDLVKEGDTAGILYGGTKKTQGMRVVDQSWKITLVSPSGKAVMVVPEDPEVKAAMASTIWVPISQIRYWMMPEIPGEIYLYEVCTSVLKNIHFKVRQK